MCDSDSALIKTRRFNEAGFIKTTSENPKPSNMQKNPQKNQKVDKKYFTKISCKICEICQTRFWGFVHGGGHGLI